GLGRRTVEHPLDRRVLEGGEPRQDVAHGSASRRVVGIAQDDRGRASVVPGVGRPGGRLALLERRIRPAARRASLRRSSRTVRLWPWSETTAITAFPPALFSAAARTSPSRGSISSSTARALALPGPLSCCSSSSPEK